MIFKVDAIRKAASVHLYSTTKVFKHTYSIHIHHKMKGKRKKKGESMRWASMCWAAGPVSPPKIPYSYFGGPRRQLPPPLVLLPNDYPITSLNAALP